MIKYRVKQIGKLFYPQKKVLLFWKYIKIHSCERNRYYSLTLHAGTRILHSTSLEGAVNDINNYKNNYLRPFVCCGHVVKTFLNTNDNTYMYVDTSDDFDIYSSSAEEVCERISVEIEEEKKRKKDAKKVTIHNVED